MPATSDQASTTQIRGSSLLLVGQAFAVIVNLASQVLVVRYLSQESYGVFAYALSFGTITEIAVAFGMRRGLARYMPIYHESGDLARTSGVLVLALGTVLSLGFAAMFLVIVFRGAFVGSFENESTAAIVLVLLTGLSALSALGTLLDGVLAVFARPRAIVARRFIVGPLFRLIAVILLLAGNKGVVFLAGGYAGAALLGLTLYIPLLMPILREQGLTTWLRPGRFKVPAREVLSFTVPLLASDLTAVMLISSGGIVLGLMAMTTDVAELRAVLPIATTMSYVLSSFGLLLVPITARLYARSDSAGLNQVYWRTAAWTGVLAFPIFLVCVVLAEPLTVLMFGDAYKDAAPVLAVLAIGLFVSTAAGHNELLLGVFGRVRFIVMVDLIAIALNVALVLLLAPRFAAVGAAAASTATLVFLNVAFQVGLGLRTDVRGLDPEIVPLYGAMLGTSAVAVALQLTIQPPALVSVGLVLVAVGVVAAVAHTRLALAETFPELARIPLVRKLVGAADR